MFGICGLSLSSNFYCCLVDCIWGEMNMNTNLYNYYKYGYYQVGSKYNFQNLIVWHYIKANNLNVIVIKL